MNNKIPSNLTKNYREFSSRGARLTPNSTIHPMSMDIENVYTNMKRTVPQGRKIDLARAKASVMMSEKANIRSSKSSQLRHKQITNSFADQAISHSKREMHSPIMDQHRRRNEMHGYLPSADMPLGEDMHTETASIQNFRSTATNEKLKGRTQMQLPHAQSVELRGRQQAIPDGTSLIAGQSSRDQGLPQHRQGANSTFDKHQERALNQGPHGQRFIQGMGGQLHDQYLDDEQHEADQVDVLSRSESQNSSHHDADGENSEADSDNNNVAYYKKHRQSRK